MRRTLAAPRSSATAAAPSARATAPARRARARRRCPGHGILEATLRRLEAEELPLEEALALFERGQALAARCNELLDQAELKLRKLMPDEGGGYSEADLDLEEEESP